MLKWIIGSNLEDFMYKTIFLTFLVLLLAGCLAIKTEHEVKPINITMDINLKVDGAIDEALSETDHTVVKSLLDSGRAGFNKKSLLEARTAVTSEEMEEIVKSNSRIKKRLEQIASSKNLTTDEFLEQNRDKFISHIRPGIWYQQSDDTWIVKK